MFKLKVDIPKDKKGAEFELTQDKITSFCIDICGGAYTTSQTVKAMNMLDKLMRGEVVSMKHPVSGKRFKFAIIDGLTSSH